MDISLRVPRLTAFSIEAVHTFVDDYEAYIACGGRAHPRVMTASSLLVVLVAKSKGKVDVGQCDEKEYMTFLKTLVAPTSMVDTFDRLGKYSLEKLSLSDVADYIRRYDLLLSNVSQTSTPPFEELKKLFLANIRNPRLRQMVKLRPQKTINETYAALMEGFEEYEFCVRSMGIGSGNSVGTSKDVKDVKPTIQCHKCGKHGHKSPDCPTNRNVNFSAAPSNSVVNSGFKPTQVAFGSSSGSPASSSSLNPSASSPRFQRPSYPPGPSTSNFSTPGRNNNNTGGNNNAPSTFASHPYGLRSRTGNASGPNVQSPTVSKIPKTMMVKVDDSVPPPMFTLDIGTFDSPDWLRVDAVLDTGSSINLVGSNIVYELPQHHIRAVSPLTLNTGNGRTFVNQAIDLEMKYPHPITNVIHENVHTFYITDKIVDSLVIGYQTLLRTGLIHAVLPDTDDFDSTFPDTSGSAVSSVAIVVPPVPSMDDGIFDNPLWTKDETSNSSQHDDDFLDDFSDDNHIVSDSSSDGNLIPNDVQQVLDKYPTVTSESLSSPAYIEPMKIVLKDNAAPVSIPPRRVAPAMREIIRENIEMLLENNIIRPSRSPWSSPILMVKQKLGWRFCIDFREVNKLSVPTRFPLPNNQELLSHAAGYDWFIKLDLKKGFWQAPLDDDSCAITAFATPDGQYEYVRCPMGFVDTPSHFQRAMIHILNGLDGNILECFIDDILIYAHSRTELLQRLDIVLERLANFNIRINLQKCSFALRQVDYLGYVVNGAGISVSESRRDAIRNIIAPTSSKQLRAFLGLINFFRRVIQDFAIIASVLYKLTSPRAPFHWSDECQVAFATLKQKLMDAPLLSHLDYAKTIYLRTDASIAGVGGVLFQYDSSDNIQPVLFMSKAFTETEKKWSTIEIELFAIYYCIMHCESYLLGHHFVVECDHRNLQYLQKATAPKLVRMRLNLQKFDFSIRHIPGIENCIADGLSRCLTTVVDVQSNADQQPATSSVSDVNNSNLNVLSDTVAINPPSRDDNKEALSPIITITDHTSAVSPDIHQDSTINDNSNSRLHAISKVHNMLVGHGGIQTTLDRLSAQNIIWHGMKRDVTDYIESCPCCQKIRLSQGDITQTIHATVSYQPLETICIDTIGPLPVDDYGNKFIITMIDSATRFTVLYPSPSCEAVYAAAALIQFFGLFGPFRFLRSDRGSQYVNDLISEFLKHTNTAHLLSVAYHPEANGTVERCNQEVMKHLRSLIFDNQLPNLWSLHLPIIQRILNSNIHSALGCSPSSMLFGLFHNSNNIWSQPRGGKADDKDLKLNGFVKDSIELQSNLLRVSLKRQQQVIDDRLQTGLKENPNPTTFPLGSFVLTKYPNRPPSKLAPVWKGPLKVKSVQGNTYLLEDQNLLKDVEYHVSDLKAYNDKRTKSIVAVSARDRNELVVDRIISHTGSPKRKTGMKFIVRYKDMDGYEEEVPWKVVQPLAALDVYSKEKQLKL